MVSTLSQDGTEDLGPGGLMYHYPGTDMPYSGYLLTTDAVNAYAAPGGGAGPARAEHAAWPVLARVG